MNFIGVNPLKIEGYKDESYGYSRFVNIKLKNKKYRPVISAVINPWGIKKQLDAYKNNKGIIKDEKNHLFFSNEITNAKTNGFIAGYNSINLGNRIWTPKSGFNLGLISEFKKINIKVKWEYESTGASNFAFDIWLTKNKDGPLSEEDIELMVWLDYNFDFPIKTVGEDDKFLIKYIKKKPMLYLPTYHWFTFLNKNKTGIIDFDLIELFEKCKGLINLKDYHIRSIELGNEYSKNTKVKTKLFKVDFNFIKKQEFKINIKHKRLS